MASLQDRIQNARASNALTFREVEPGASNSDDAQVRRQRVIERAQGMLDGAREAVQEGLEDAIRNEDYDAIEEYLEVLEKLKPLPTGIVPTNDEPDYKRYLDPKSLKS